MDVDLGQDVVKYQVLELLLVADVMVDGARDDPQAGGQAAHGQGLDAVVRDDRQRLGDHPLAGEPGAAVLVVDGRVNHSERALRRSQLRRMRSLLACREQAVAAGPRGLLERRS